MSLGIFGKSDRKGITLGIANLLITVDSQVGALFYITIGWERIWKFGCYDKFDIIYSFMKYRCFFLLITSE